MKREYTVVKVDTEENWKKAKNFIPDDKELIFYINPDESTSLKIGDGKTKLNDLPFISGTEYFVEDDTLVINTYEGRK